jgi:hypothetical protein
MGNGEKRGRGPRWDRKGTKKEPGWRSMGRRLSVAERSSERVYPDDAGRIAIVIGNEQRLFFSSFLT